jgi:hypothetical protein
MASESFMSSLLCRCGSFVVGTVGLVFVLCGGILLDRVVHGHSSDYFDATCSVNAGEGAINFYISQYDSQTGLPSESVSCCAYPVMVTPLKPVPEAALQFLKNPSDQGFMANMPARACSTPNSCRAFHGWLVHHHSLIKTSCWCPILRLVSLASLALRS